MHHNFKGIEKTVYGRGSFNQLGEILREKRGENAGFMVFIVDQYFQGRPLADRIPSQSEDITLYLNVDEYEPKTSQIDEMRDNILQQGLPAAVIGIGGGSIMDIAKATALMLTNEGSSTLYQGLNLVKKPGVYHVGVPTISGTGAECSMTAVLTGPEKKLGLKCDWTVFNQVVLDPDLTSTVPTNQWFYTGMDCYIHCIESESGIKYNTYSKAYGDQSLQLCREVFLGASSGQNPENDEKLMVASLFGGLSLTYSEVGICHALSYGLSVVFGLRHGIANCIAFNHLEDYYPTGVAEFKQMVEKHQVDLPQNLAMDWTDEQVTEMAKVAYALDHMWNHAVGPDWKRKVNIDTIKDLYYRL